MTVMEAASADRERLLESVGVEGPDGQAPSQTSQQIETCELQGTTYGGLFVKSVLRMIGTRVISRTSWI